MNIKVTQTPQEYLGFSDAADDIGLTPKKLLNLSLAENAEILAAVVSGGQYEWPRGSEGLPFPEIDDPVRREFNASDRVILSRAALVHIEGVGWCIPKFFAAPSKAREVIEYLEFCKSVTSESNDELTSDQFDAAKKKAIKVLKSKLSKLSKQDLVMDAVTTFKGEDGEVVQSLAQQKENIQSTIKFLQSDRPKGLDGEELRVFRECGFYSPWYPVDPIADNAERTTIDHLFISAKELERLKAVLKCNKQEAEMSSKPADTPYNMTKWKMVMQEQATIFCLEYYKKGGYPSILTLADDLAKWSSANNVKTSTGILPAASHIYTNAIGSKTKWKRPPRPSK